MAQELSFVELRRRVNAVSATSRNRTTDTLRPGLNDDDYAERTHGHLGHTFDGDGTVNSPFYVVVAEPVSWHFILVRFWFNFRPRIWEDARYVQVGPENNPFIFRLTPTGFIDLGNNETILA